MIGVQTVGLHQVAHADGIVPAQHEQRIAGPDNIDDPAGRRIRDAAGRNERWNLGWGGSFGEGGSKSWRIGRQIYQPTWPELKAGGNAVRFHDFVSSRSRPGGQAVQRIPILNGIRHPIRGLGSADGDFCRSRGGCEGQGRRGRYAWQGHRGGSKEWWDGGSRRGRRNSGHRSAFE